MARELAHVGAIARPIEDRVVAALKEPAHLKQLDDLIRRESPVLLRGIARKYLPGLIERFTPVAIRLVIVVVASNWGGALAPVLAFLKPWVDKYLTEGGSRYFNESIEAIREVLAAEGGGSFKLDPPGSATGLAFTKSTSRGVTYDAFRPNAIDFRLENGALPTPHDLDSMRGRFDDAMREIEALRKERDDANARIAVLKLAKAPDEADATIKALNERIKQLEGRDVGGATFVIDEPPKDKPGPLPAPAPLPSQAPSPAPVARGILASLTSNPLMLAMAIVIAFLAYDRFSSRSSSPSKPDVVEDAIVVEAKGLGAAYAIDLGDAAARTLDATADAIDASTYRDVDALVAGQRARFEKDLEVAFRPVADALAKRFGASSKGASIDKSLARFDRSLADGIRSKLSIEKGGR